MELIISIVDRDKIMKHDGKLKILPVNVSKFLSSNPGTKTYFVVF